MSDTIVIACPSCRVKNRVPITRITKNLVGALPKEQIEEAIERII